jgi:hypothetical protein
VAAVAVPQVVVEVAREAAAVEDGDEQVDP